MHIPHLKKILIFTIIGGILITAPLFGAALFVIRHDQAAAATIADNYLRPIFGDRAVIALEGFVFGIQDKINHFKNEQPTIEALVPNVPIAAVASTSPSTPGASPTPIPKPVPSPIAPILTAKPLAGEGIWSHIVGTDMDTTFIRSDPSREYSVTTLVRLPMKTLSLGAVAGTKYPGGPAGPGKVPEAIAAPGKLVAGFEGGFQQKDGNYGMMVDGITYVPFRTGLSVLSIHADGHADMGIYDGKPFASDIIAARQNGPLLVRNATTEPSTARGIDLWAGTAAGDFITWRSGLGITKEGDLLYAVGSSLSPASLAEALRVGGSQTAMQLDINAYWVRFFVYTSTGNGHYSSTALLKGMPSAGAAYLSGNEKDFFYAYSK
jgi:hypothetical protein